MVQISPRFRLADDFVHGKTKSHYLEQILRLYQFTSAYPEHRPVISHAHRWSLPRSDKLNDNLSFTLYPSDVAGVYRYSGHRDLPWPHQSMNTDLDPIKCN